MKSITLILAASALVVACGVATKKAPVEDRYRQTHKTGVGVVEPKDSATQYVVKRGDTLYRIALEKGQSYSDIVSWNNLTNPSDIKVGQVLRIAPPDGVNTVGSLSGVEVRPLDSAVTPNNTGVATHNKNGPRADKRPYSDATLAEMKKGDQTNPALGTNTLDLSAKTAEKSPEGGITGEIVWIWPTEGKVIASFDDNKNKGVDIVGKMGQDVLAAAAGTVMYAGSGIRGYGNLVIIKHTHNFLSAYANNKSILVKEKQSIAQGQKIAEMGNSDSEIVKLHFEVRQQGKPVDPMKFLPRQ
jgi:lipoprotein NlpD